MSLCYFDPINTIYKTYKEMSDEEYDGMVVFDNPICINVDGEDREIYGLLYTAVEAHKEDLWIWNLNKYISYLTVCMRVQRNGATLEPDAMINNQGRIIPLNPRIKNLTYLLLREKMTGYRIVEFPKPLTIFSDERDDRFIVSVDLLKRYGIEINRIKPREEDEIEEDVE